MVGLIWFVQTVHYPLFRAIGNESFSAYHEEHSSRISKLLVLPALTELITAAGLLWVRPSDVPLPAVLVGGALLAAIWIVTLLVQVPQHRRLAAGSGLLQVRLVEANWVRTALWTVRGSLVIWMVVQ